MKNPPAFPLRSVFPQWQRFFRSSSLSFFLNPPALLLYFTPLNHQSCEGVRAGERCSGATWAGTRRQDSCRYEEWAPAVRSRGVAPVSPRFISPSDARESVAYEDIMFSGWARCMNPISQILFVSYESGPYAHDDLCRTRLPPVGFKGDVKVFGFFMVVVGGGGQLGFTTVTMNSYLDPVSQWSKTSEPSPAAQSTSAQNSFSVKFPLSFSSTCFHLCSVPSTGQQHQVGLGSGPNGERACLKRAGSADEVLCKHV